MKIPVSRLPQLVAVLVPLACGPRIQSTLLTATHPEPTPSEVPVAVLSQAPSCPHAVVGTVRAWAEEYMLVREAKFRAALVRRAREMGGDAVIVRASERTVDEPTNPTDLADPRTTTWKVKQRDAVVLRYTDPSCRTDSKG